MAVTDAPNTVMSDSKGLDVSPTLGTPHSVPGEDETEWKAGRQEMLILATMSVLSIVIAVSVVPCYTIFHAAYLLFCLVANSLPFSLTLQSSCRH